MSNRARRFKAEVIKNQKGRVLVPLPFEPDDVWGHKPSHPVAGSVNGMRVRAVVEPIEAGWGIVLGPAWRRDCGIAPGDVVNVILEPEGPQRDDLADDIAGALAAEPEAAAFFDGLAQFYRNAYLRWIDGTKRRPDVRAARIAEVVDLLKAGVKERPRDVLSPVGGFQSDTHALASLAAPCGPNRDLRAGRREPNERAAQGTALSAARPFGIRDCAGPLLALTRRSASGRGRNPRGRPP